MSDIIVLGLAWFFAGMLFTLILGLKRHPLPDWEDLTMGQKTLFCFLIGPVGWFFSVLVNLWQRLGRE